MRKTFLSIGTLVVLLLALTVVSTRAAPEMQVSPPGRLTYQGHLMDEAGNAVPDGDYVMTFTLYDAPSGGNLLWGPESHTVSVDDAYFTALLGRDDPIDAEDLADTTYLEITVSGETMTPRHQFTSVAFALVAQECMSCTVSGESGGGDAWLLSGNNAPVTATLGTSNSTPLTLTVNDNARLVLYSNSTVAAGNVGSHDVSGSYVTIGGGNSNEASSNYSTVGGGNGNEASSLGATVAGGGQNTAGAYSYATVVGGSINTASGYASFVGGGTSNTASGQDATISGGNTNVASDMYATVPGGADNTASGEASFAAGRHAHAAHDGAFVWGDSASSGVDVSSSGPHQFVVRASGGYSMYTSSDLSSGAYLAAGSGSWASMSDRNVKENVEPVDEQAVLDALAMLEIATWNYTAQSDTVRHVGPMAQDFYAAFGYGDSDRYISSVDADGVSLAAIQALLERIEALEARVKALEVHCDCGTD